MPRPSRLARIAISAASALILAGCAAVMQALPLLEQAACVIVPVLVPGSSALVGSVCKDVLPAVNVVITEIAGEVGAEMVARDAKGCKLVPITADGVSGLGVVCSSICGMATPTATDPCPRVDAKLRALAGARAGR